MPEILTVSGIFLFFYHAYDHLQAALIDSQKIFPKFSCYRFARQTHSGLVILNLFQNLKNLSLATVTTPTTVYKPLFKDSRKIFPKFSCYRFARLTHSGIVILNLFQNLKDLSLATVTTPTTIYKPLLKTLEKSFPNSLATALQDKRTRG